MKAKPKKKKTRAAKKSPTRSKAKLRRRPVTKAKRKAVARPKVAAKRRPAAKPKRKAVTKPKRTAAAKAKPKAAAKPAAKLRGAAKPKAVSKPASKSVAKPKPGPAPAAVAPRRDATGHLSAKYASDLHARSQESAERKDAPSFVHGSKSGDPLAEELGEEFVKTALSGEDSEALDQVVPEERGGPFVESTGGTEFAEGTDASNPKGAKVEPFPTT